MNLTIEDYSLESGYAECRHGANEFTKNFTNVQLIEAASDLKFINAPLSCDENECTYFSPAFPGQMESKNLDKVTYLNPLKIIGELSGEQILQILLYICVEEPELNI